MATTVGTFDLHLVDVVSFQKVADIIEAGKLMAAALEKMDEWIAEPARLGDPPPLYCPVCGADEPDGHYDGCQNKQQALAAWKAITEGDE